MIHVRKSKKIKKDFTISRRLSHVRIAKLKLTFTTKKHELVCSLIDPVFKPKIIKLVIAKTLIDRNYNACSSWLTLHSGSIEIKKNLQDNSLFVKFNDPKIKYYLVGKFSENIEIESQSHPHCVKLLCIVYYVDITDKRFWKFVKYLF